MRTLRIAATADPGVEEADVREPVAKAGQVVVDVRAVALSSWEKSLALQTDARKVGRTRRGRRVSMGLEFSGVVRTEGTRFAPGSRVMGTVDLAKDEKALAERVAVREDLLIEIPASLGFVEAASFAVGSATSLRALRGRTHLRQGQRILIAGAAGGVGVYAVQIASATGAHVSTFARPEAATALGRLGAAETYSSLKQAFDDQEPYDIVFDLTGTLRLSAVNPHVNHRGSFITATPQKDVGGLIRSVFTRTRFPLLYVPHVPQEELQTALDLVTTGAVQPVVDQVHHVDQYARAFRALTAGGTLGKIILTF